MKAMLRAHVAVTDKEPAPSLGKTFGVPIGTFAVPAIHYEWYLVNEETVGGLFHARALSTNGGGAIHDMLAADGERILEEHNKLEDAIIHDLQDKLYDVKMQEHVVKDANDIRELRIASYEKLNAAGVIKPQFEFKAQMERLLTMMEVEELSMQEKTKAAIMEEARVSVTAEFSTNQELKKTSLASAIAQLKGSSTGASDPVKAAYLAFFKTKGVAAAKMDEKVELAANRAAMVAKLNAVASNEGFFFELDASGKPKMTV
jgi:hypothetical protein